MRMFIPVKADFVLPKFPWMTLVVCAICVVVFFDQVADRKAFYEGTERYCHADRSRIEEIVFTRIAELEEYGYCNEMMMEIAMAKNGSEVIDDIAGRLKPLAGFNREDSRTYVQQMLQDELQRYRSMVGDLPDEGRAYYTESWNPWTMITSAFAHGDFWHIFFNLIFFFAFAATVEALIGPVAFAASIIGIAIFTAVFTSVGAYASGRHVYSLGLSGVVWGMMGLFGYLLPHGKIRVYYWFIVIFGYVAVPAWALTLWYVGGEVWKLLSVDDHGVINVMAHATGGIAGYLIGILFLSKAKQAAKDLQFELDFHKR